MGKPALTMTSFTQALLADNIDGPWAKLESPSAELLLGLRLGFGAKLAAECGLHDSNAWTRAACVGYHLLNRQAGAALGISTCKRLGSAMMAWRRDANGDDHSARATRQAILSGVLNYEKHAATISDILSSWPILEAPPPRPTLAEIDNLFSKRSTPFLAAEEWQFIESLPQSNLTLASFLEHREIAAVSPAPLLSRSSPRI